MLSERPAAREGGAEHFGGDQDRGGEHRGHVDPVDAAGALGCVGRVEHGRQSIRNVWRDQARFAGAPRRTTLRQNPGDFALMTAQTAANPLLAAWDAPFGAPPLDRDQAGALSRPPSSAALARAPRRDRRDRRRRGGAGLREHRRGAGALRAPARPGVERVLRAGRRAHQRGDPGDRARHGAAARAPLERDPPERKAVRAARCRAPAAQAGLTAEQARVLERYHAMFRRAGAGLDAAGEAAAEGDRRAAREPRHDVRPERARRRAVLRDAARRGRPRRACRISPARRRAAPPTSAA